MKDLESVASRMLAALELAHGAFAAINEGYNSGLAPNVFSYEQKQTAIAIKQAQDIAIPREKR